MAPSMPNQPLIQTLAAALTQTCKESNQTELAAEIESRKNERLQTENTFLRDRNENLQTVYFSTYLQLQKLKSKNMALKRINELQQCLCESGGTRVVSTDTTEISEEAASNNPIDSAYSYDI